MLKKFALASIFTVVIAPSATAEATSLNVRVAPYREGSFSVSWRAVLETASTCHMEVVDVSTSPPTEDSDGAINITTYIDELQPCRAAFGHHSGGMIFAVGDEPSMGELDGESPQLTEGYYGLTINNEFYGVIDVGATAAILDEAEPR